MKQRYARLGAVTVLTVLLVTAAQDLVAQENRAPAGASAAAATDMLRIRRFTGLGRRGLVSTPQYRTDAPSGNRPIGEWAQLEVMYDTAPAWIDELMFRYHALALREERGAAQYSLYRQTVRYVDIEEGRNHRGTVFLRPNTVKRYGEVVAIAVEILYDGKVVAVESDTSARNIPPDWWRNPRVTDSAAVIKRDGYLLSRSQTPFAFINYDDYEAEK